MPERKSHVKSRLGCAQCKSRRVKCDEVWPTCGNCRRRKEKCSYTNPKSAHSSGLSPNSSNGLDTPDTNHAVHLKQLELMHQYSTSTWETLSIDRDILGSLSRVAYQIEVPRLALSYDFLMDTIFAISALHLAYLRPAESLSYVADATHYHTRALAACRQSLMSFDASGCMAMYYASVQLGMIPLALRAVDAQAAATHTPTETISQLAALWHGSWSIILASKDLMDEETHNLFFPKPEWSNRNGTMLGAQTQPFLNLLRGKAQAQSSSPSENDDASEIYLQVIDQLEMVIDAVEIEFSRVLAWVVVIPHRFHELLLQGRPVANAIILLYSVTFNAMEDRWWATNFARSLVDQLKPLVAASDPDYADMINFVEMKTSPAVQLAPLTRGNGIQAASVTNWSDIETPITESPLIETSEGVGAVTT